MKILIGYEGSVEGDAAIQDLKRAGLPPEGEATVFTVADTWPLAVDDPSFRAALGIPSVRAAHLRAKGLLTKAESIARRGADRARAMLPGWRVTGESVADSPAWAIFKKARDAGSDLVIVGCRERKGLSRWMVGSVSHKVLTECPVSVRISRPQANRVGPQRILIGVDGSSDADRAVSHVLDRCWPENTMVRVLAVADHRLLDAPFKIAALTRWVKPTDTDPAAWLGRLVESVERRFLEKGMAVSGRVRAGEPKRVLVEQASRWRADVIFLGARGLTRTERLVLGSVSTSVAVRAPCSVEVVRARGK